MTKRVSPSEQGQLQGALTSVRGIVGFFGPLIFPFSFATAISVHSKYELPGAPYFLASGLMLTGFVLAWRVTRPQAEPADQPIEQELTEAIEIPLEIESEAMPNVSIDAPR
jgi:DHA1 family tetracycline resistance protein-like MFS transporter